MMKSFGENDNIEKISYQKRYPQILSESPSMLPNPTITQPLILPNGEVWPHLVYLKNVIDHPRMEIGDYTYYNDHDDPKDYARKLAPYLHPPSPEKLIIGKFVQIAHGVQFITSSANHQMDGISTYTFATFIGDWNYLETNYANKGNTVIGNDVWIGHEAVIMPGVTVGSGAIIGARSVVTKDVPPYTIVGGNPAKVIRARFNENDIKDLLEIAWWEWDISKIEEHMQLIISGKPKDLKAAL